MMCVCEHNKQKSNQRGPTSNVCNEMYNGEKKKLIIMWRTKPNILRMKIEKQKYMLRFACCHDMFEMTYSDINTCNVLICWLRMAKCSITHCPNGACTLLSHILIVLVVHVFLAYQSRILTCVSCCLAELFVLLFCDFPFFFIYSYSVFASIFNSTGCLMIFGTMCERHTKDTHNKMYTEYTCRRMEWEKMICQLRPNFGGRHRNAHLRRAQSKLKKKKYNIASLNERKAGWHIERRKSVSERMRWFSNGIEISVENSQHVILQDMRVTRSVCRILAARSQLAKWA